MPLDKQAAAQQLTLLVAHRRTLNALLYQQALLGVAFVSPGVINSIQEARAEIQRIKTTLRSNEIIVDDEPDDEMVLHNLPEGNKPTPQEHFTGFGRLIATIRILIDEQENVSEIKNAHNMLHNFKTSLSTVTLYVRSMKKGANPNIVLVESIWNNCANHLQVLCDFASKDLRYLNFSGPMLTITSAGEISGPSWIALLASLHRDIKVCIDDRDITRLFKLLLMAEHERDLQMIVIDKELLKVVNRINQLTSFILGVIGDDPAIR